MPRLSDFRRILLIGISFGYVFAQSQAAEPLAGAQSEFFENKIRPFLAEQCYKCHNSAERADGGLALDSRPALLKGGDGGLIVVAGKPPESRLLAILRHEVPGLKMPQDGAKLDDSVIADFEKWIAMGAFDPRDTPPTAQELADATSWENVFKKRLQWWSFQPIRQVSPPDHVGNDWSSHPIDKFVVAKLNDANLKPSSPAEPRVLVRRLFFALNGLPPTAEEIQYWTRRLEQPDGFDALLNDLLERPQFGERWARHWMDWVRYAETHGSEGDPVIENAWQYRDYLIRALNADISYDQLVREQIAGDLLEHPRIDESRGINESVIGPAHWRMVFHGFAPTDPLDEKVRFIDDEISAFSKAFLGLTISCARCHDHKFDPISQKDYYALFGILGSCRPGRVAIDTAEQLNRNRSELEGLKSTIRSAIAADWRNEAAQFRERIVTRQDDPKSGGRNKLVLNHWFEVKKDLADGRSFAEAWKRREAFWTADRQARKQQAERSYFQRWDLTSAADYGTWFTSGCGLLRNPSKAGEFSVAASGEKALAAIYPAGVYSNLISAKHPGRLSSSYVRLDAEYELWIRAIGDGGASVRYAVQDYPRDGTVFPIRKLTSNWEWHKFDLTYWNGDEIDIELATGQDAPILVNNEPRSSFGISQALIQRKGEPAPLADTQEFLDSLFESTADAPPKSLDELADRYTAVVISAVKAWELDSMTDGQALLIDACLRQGLLSNQLDQFATAKSIFSQYRRLENEIPVPTRVPGLQETIARNQPLFVRGNHKQPAEDVPRRFLDAIDARPYDTNQSGRRQLAEDLLRDDNPLTRRVVVNRIWHHLFGRGIVATPDNFGRLGMAPSHPELLDYLATRFKDQGGSIKQMIRFIVSSKTWQLSSIASDQSRAVDPDNQLLSHANLRRLEAEAIRDSLLGVSGILDSSLFGSPVDGSSNRRSIYVRVARNSLDPFLRSFDFPEPFSTVGRRDVTNVPAQSLTMLNDQQLEKIASAWASRIIGNKKLSDDDKRLEQMFLRAFGRTARASESDQLKQYLVTTTSERREIGQQVATLRKQIEQRTQSTQSIVDPIRHRLMAELDSSSLDRSRPLPQPVGHWEFDTDANDLIGSCHGKLVGDAKIEDGQLILKHQGYVTTAPLQRTIKAKTLEAWVQLDNLEQRGGGLMTIQSQDGAVFDSIVFAEQHPKQWLAGSNFFERTQSFQAPQENDALDRPVHVAIVYQADGQVIGYRDGQPYGKPYQSKGVHEFKAGETVISFGIRHLPAGGNRMLEGRILRAHLYDHALSAEEVQATSRAAKLYVSESQITAAMSDAEKIQYEADKRQIAEAEAAINSWGTLADAADEVAIWTDLARAVLTFQELIFVQ